MKEISAERKKVIALAVFILILVCSIFFPMASAYYKRDIGQVKNDFKPAVSVDPSIAEDFKDGDTVKKDAKINVGDTGYPVYVRAAIVVTWQDKNGVVYFDKPTTGNLNATEDDYSIELNLDDWTYNEDDDYYYYKHVVQSQQDTEVLIKECTTLKKCKDENYTLNVEIIAQTVQAIGTTDDDSSMAVEDAWRWTPSEKVGDIPEESEQPMPEPQESMPEPQESAPELEPTD